MTMSLVRGMSTLNTKKPKQRKRTKAQQAKFEQDHRAYNKSMKRMGCHNQMMTLDEYDLYVRGLYKPKQTKTEFKEYNPAPAYRRSTPDVPSLGDGIGNGKVREANVYSGERQLLGIATMHKSNMVPIFADKKEEAKEIAQMRRN